MARVESESDGGAAGGLEMQNGPEIGASRARLVVRVGLRVQLTIVAVIVPVFAHEAAERGQHFAVGLG